MSKTDAPIPGEKASENDAPSTAEPASENDVSSAGKEVSKRTGLLSERGLLIILIILSFVGVATSNFNPVAGSWYWLAMIPVFAVVAMITGRSKIVAPEGAIVQSGTIVQLLHWGVALLTAGALSVFRTTGRLDDENFSLVMLLILALATVLDGIRLGWLLTLVGAFLGLSAVIAAYMDEYLWIILALCTAIVLISIYWKRGR